MAFNVTPSRGGAPYVFTAEFTDQVNFLPSRYTLLFRNNSTVGSCASSVSGNSNPTAAQALMQNNTYTLSGPSVPAGSCNRYRITVYDVITDMSISSLDVTVDNTA